MLTLLKPRGKGYVLELDREMLRQLSIDPGQPIEVVAYGQRIVLSPTDGLDRPRRIEQALDDLDRRHGDALAELAKQRDPDEVFSVADAGFSMTLPGTVQPHPSHLSPNPKEAQLWPKVV